MAAKNTGNGGINTRLVWLVAIACVLWVAVVLLVVLLVLPRLNGAGSGTGGSQSSAAAGSAQSEATSGVVGDGSSGGGSSSSSNSGGDSGAASNASGTAESSSAGSWSPWPEKETYLLFSSGVGAWGTFMCVQPDGSFRGYWYDSNVGDTGSGYPRGTTYYTFFEGQFGEYLGSCDSAIMKMTSFRITNKAGEVIDNKTRYIYVNDSVYGIGTESEAKEKYWYLYPPGISVSKLPSSAKSWMDLGSKTATDNYTLISYKNSNEALPFVGQNGYKAYFPEQLM